MDIAIASEKDNKLMDRKEMDVRLAYKGPTPPKKEIREAIGRKFGINPELISIRKIKNEFGRSQVHVDAFAYANKEAYSRYEPRHILVRYGEKEKKPKKVKAKKAPAAKKE